MLIYPDSISGIATLTPSSKWLQRGLVFVMFGGKAVWSAQQRKRPISQNGGPKVAGSKWGQVVGFGTTAGTGTTDRLDGGVLPPPSSKWRSIVAHVYIISGGGGGFGRIFQDVSGTGLTTGESLVMDSGKIDVSVATTAQSGQWRASTSSPTGAWSSIGVTHDRRTIDLFPLMYVNGASSSVTAVQGASGTYLTAATNMSFGNRSSDDARCFDGWIGPILIFDGALTDDEHASLARDPLQVFSPDELCVWFPGAGGAAALAGGATGEAAASGYLTTQIQINAAAAVIETASGSLTTAIPLAGSAASVTVSSGVLTANIRLAGDAIAQALASASLSGGSAALAGGANAAAASSGQLTTSISLSGSAVAQALASAGLTTVPSGLSGSASVSAVSSGALSTSIAMVGQASALAISTGGVSTGIQLTGSAAAVSAATGNLTISTGLSADAFAQAAVAGTLSTQIRLDAAAVAQALASAGLSTGGSVDPFGDPRYTLRFAARNSTLTARARNWGVSIQ